MTGAKSTGNDFYPRPPRGGRPRNLYTWRCAKHISIHALREEGDPLGTCNADRIDIFLSTPSARRATCHQAVPHSGTLISIHALREEGDGKQNET